MDKEKKKIKLAHHEIDVRQFLEILGVYVALFMVAAGAYYLGPAITGFATVKKQVNYTDDINLHFSESGTFVWSMENPGELRSVKIDGRIRGNGTAKVYLESNGQKLLMLDSPMLAETASGIGITGFAVKGEEDKDEKSEDEPKTKEENETKGKMENKIPKWISVADNFIIDETLIVNLSNYFIDEDNDILAYSASNVSNISISLDNGIITFEPEKGIEDARQLIIAAYDGKNITYKAIELMIRTRENIRSNKTNESIDRTIKLNLNYDNKQPYDPNNDGTESPEGIVDITAKNTIFNWQVDMQKLCTRYEIYSIENEESSLACFGNDECCSLFNLGSSREFWNETLYIAYGDYGTSFTNMVFAQVLYADYDLNAELPSYEAVYSEWGNLTVEFIEGIIEFEDACIDSCFFEGNETSYTLIVELDNIELEIDKIKYALEEEIANENPILIYEIENISIGVNGSIALDLSQYFKDNDGDELSYNYFPMEDIRIEFNKNTANIAPEKGFEGVRFAYIEASDSYDKIVSNVFRIEVREKETPSIRLLNVQKENETLIVEFETKGISNLAITPVNSASFTELYDDNLLTKNSLEPLKLKCGDFEIFDKEKLVEASGVSFILANGSKFALGETLQHNFAIRSMNIEDYSCNETSYYHANLLDDIKNDEEFAFGKDAILVALPISSATFEIRDKEDNKLAIIDSMGNMEIKGVLEEAIPIVEGFIVYNSTNGVNLVVAEKTGNLHLIGTLYENQTILIPPPNSFIVQDKYGQVIAYVSDSGSLFLKGIMNENSIVLK